MVSMPPTPILFFLPVVLTAVTLLAAAEAAHPGRVAISKAGADVSSFLVAVELAWLRREVVEKTTLLQYILVSMGGQ